MGKIKLEEIKKIELDTLSYVAKLCEDNNLRYFLCGGTLLGAVRHKGFIPWDDDIDIAMPRPDYDRLFALLDDNDKYTALSMKNKDYYYNFGKIVDKNTTLTEYGHNAIENMGVYIDIFPLEGMPKDEAKQDRHFGRLDKLRKKINNFSIVKPKIRKNLAIYMKTLYIYEKCKRINLSELQHEYKSLAKKYSYDEADVVYMTGGAYGKVEMFPKYFVDNYIELEFEGKMFKCPKNYDLYLEKLYGNYMKLPPKEKQVTHHNFSAEYRMK